MDIVKICKNSGYFCVGASLWVAEKTAAATVNLGKATVKSAKAMAEKGENYMAAHKATKELMREQQERAEDAEQKSQGLDSNCQVAGEIIPACSCS